jgi:uncharacterized protein (DUF488 family)
MDGQSGRRVYTIGHSNHPLELLRQQSIEVVADTRSLPRCNYATHFNGESLERSLIEAGFRYVYLGHQLGGRPQHAEFYDADGHVDYARVAQSEAFSMESGESSAASRSIAWRCCAPRRIQRVATGGYSSAVFSAIAAFA